MRVAYSVLLDVFFSEGCPVVNVSRMCLEKKRRKIDFCSLGAKDICIS